MTDEQHSVLNDDSLPLPARLDAAREMIRALDEARAAILTQIRALVDAVPRDEHLTATLYWEYEDLVPAAHLGKFYDLRELLEQRCPWTYPCPACGVDQRLTSRTALKELQRTLEKGPAWKLNGYRCTECREAEQKDRNRAEGERFAAYRMRLRELKTMPYREYLQTPEWQERRRARLKAARYGCQVCNAGNVRLNVHHRTYVRRGEEYARDLIVLCEKCHHLFHRNGSLAPHGEGDR